MCCWASASIASGSTSTGHPGLRARRFPFAGTSVRQVARARHRRPLTDTTRRSTRADRRRRIAALLKQPYRAGDRGRSARSRWRMTRSVPGLDLARPEGAAARALFERDRHDAIRHCSAEVACRIASMRKGRRLARNIRRYGLDAAGGLSRRRATSRSSNPQLDKRDVPCRSAVSTLDQMWSNADLQGQGNVQTGDADRPRLVRADRVRAARWSGPSVTFPTPARR